MKIIHCADLHLSKNEEEYSLGVLEEIVGHARRERADYLIMAGDIFDSFQDAEALRSEFRKRTAPLKGRTEILLLPGNHEELKQKNRRLSSLDLGPVILLDQKPFQLFSKPPIEILAVPHQQGYSDYRDWSVPPKNEKIRIAVAHGVVIGMSYSGFEEETGGAALDPDLFARFQIDFAALGHIHDRRAETINGMQLNYPGSARVWRRNETGPRGINCLTLEGEKEVDCQFIPLKASGQYREYTLPLSLEGGLEDLSGTASHWQSVDWIRLIFSGIVEDEHAVASLTEELINAYLGRVRKLEIDRESVSVLPGIASHPLARRFLKAWKAREPDPALAHERSVWLKARELALGEIKSILEARK